MVARRHHFVSRCYLKGFSAARRKGKPQVQVFDKGTHKTFPAAIDNVALERDFNTIHVEGLSSDAFESVMASFESDLGPALERIVATQSLKNEDDRAILLNFIAFLALRNPRQRELMRDFQERVAKQIMNLALATPERWANQVKKATEAGFLKPSPASSYENMKKFIEEGNYKVSVPTERHIQLEIGTFEKILPLIFRRGWILSPLLGPSKRTTTSPRSTIKWWPNLMAPWRPMLNGRSILGITISGIPSKKAVSPARLPDCSVTPPLSSRTGTMIKRSA
jgi:hypothetical protein